jgi:hypothetical protein
MQLAHSRHVAFATAEADAIGMATHLQPFSLRNRVSLIPLPTVPKRWNINKMTWQSAVVDDQIDVRMDTISLQSAIVNNDQTDVRMDTISLQSAIVNNDQTDVRMDTISLQSAVVNNDQTDVRMDTISLQSAVVNNDQIDVRMDTISLQSAVVDRESRRPIMPP